MKKNYYVLLVMALSLLAGCARVQEETKTVEEAEFENAKEFITQMGYDTSDLYKCADGYVVEGDILITDEYIEDFKNRPQTRHTFNKAGQIVALNKLSIIVAPFPNYGNEGFVNVVDDAIKYWNEKSECNIVLDKYDGFSTLSIKFEERDDDRNTLIFLNHPV